MNRLRRVRWARARSPERTPIKPETRFRRSPPVGLPGVISQRFESAAVSRKVRARAFRRLPRHASRQPPAAPLARRARQPGSSLRSGFNYGLRIAHSYKPALCAGTPAEAGARSRWTRPARPASTDCRPIGAPSDSRAIATRQSGCGAANSLDAPGRTATHRTTGLTKHASRSWRAGAPPPWGWSRRSRSPGRPRSAWKNRAALSRRPALPCFPFFTVMQGAWLRGSAVTGRRGAGRNGGGLLPPQEAALGRGSARGRLNQRAFSPLGSESGRRRPAAPSDMPTKRLERAAGARERARRRARARPDGQKPSVRPGR